MLQELNLNKLLFFDVETVSELEDYHLLSESAQALWKRKHDVLPRLQDEDLPNSYKKGAAVYAEFGKIICISCGIILDNKLEISSFYNHNESKILSDFSNFLQTKKWRFCGHNIKEFDIPYICRRMLIHGLALPDCLNIAGKKPWEVDVVDTLQLWKFGDYKSYTSLNLLAEIFQIPSPKDDVDGSQVGTVYWQEKDLERIVKYCQKDVVTVVRLLQKWKGEKLIEEDDILFKKV